MIILLECVQRLANLSGDYCTICTCNELILSVTLHGKVHDLMC